MNCAAGCSSTTTVVVAVASPLRLRAVRRYCVVRVGETPRVPLLGTVPSSVMVTVSAFRTCQSSVLSGPTRMLIGTSLEADDLNRLRRRSW